MSDRTEKWLRGEAHWARESAIKADSRAQDWRDPLWVQREQYRRQIVLYRRKVELRQAEDDLAKCDDPEKQAVREEEERDRWLALAREHEDRILSEREETLL